MKEKTITIGESTSKLGVGNSSNFKSEMVPIKLFVGGLSWQTTVEKLKEYFGQFGDITDVLLMKDPLTQRNRGFGFITFSNHDALGRVAAVPSHTLDGKKIDPKPATPKGKTKPLKPTKVFVGGVSQDSTADEVKAYFSQFGNVRETVMLIDQQTRRHRGFGFITFDSEEAVDRVCEIHFHVIKDKKVECKKAQSKEAVQARTYMGINVGAIPSLAMPAAMQSMSGHALPAAMQSMPGHGLSAAMQSMSGHVLPAAMQSMSGHVLPAAMQSMSGHVLPAAMQSMSGHVLPSSMSGHVLPAAFPGHAIQSVPSDRPPGAMQSMPGFTPHAFLHHPPPQLTASHFSASYGKLLDAQPNYRYSPYSLPTAGPAPPPRGAPPLPPTGAPPLPPTGAPPLPPTAMQPNQVVNSVIGIPPPPHTGVPPPSIKAIQSNSASGVAPQTPTGILSNQVMRPAPSTYDQLATQGTGNAQVQYSGYNLANVDMTSFGNVDWSTMVYGFPGIFY